MSSPSISSLFVERLHNRYLVPAEQLDAELLRDRLEWSVRGDLPTALASLLDRALKSDDPSVWFVRELALDFAVNTEIDHGVAARVWAEQIACELIETMGCPDAGVIRFSNRAAYLAQFLGDILDGAAWDKWYYDQFTGLRMLSVTAALRTAILDDSDIGLEALGFLGARTLQLARTLCPADAARLLSVWSAGGSGADMPSAIAAVAAAVRDPHVEAGEEHCHALTLFLSAYRNHPAFDRRALAEASRAVAHLCRYIAAGHLSANHLRAPEHLGAVFEELSPDRASILKPLLAADSSDLALMLPNPPQASPVTAAAGFTHFGGIFLLLPLIEELPSDDAFLGWPAPDDDRTSAAALVRFLVLVKCLGKHQALGCSSDPLVRKCLAIPPELAWDSIAAWSRALRPRDLERLLDSLFKGHLENGAAEGPPFELAKARRSGAPAILQIDGARGLWVRPLRPPPEAKASRDITPDLAYLSLPRTLPIGRAVDLALSIAAQGVMRCFAWKLPGFSQSSLQYLAANFLNCTAAVEWQPARAVVHLGRTPLNLILGMTGLNRCEFDVSWSPLPYAVFPEG